MNNKERRLQGVQRRSQMNALVVVQNRGKMQYITRGRKPSPYWEKLVHVGDSVILPKSQKKQAMSLRGNAYAHNLTLSVKGMADGRFHVVVTGLLNKKEEA